MPSFPFLKGKNVDKRYYPRWYASNNPNALATISFLNRWFLHIRWWSADCGSMLFIILVLAVALLLVRFFKLLGLAHQSPHELLYVWDFVVLGNVDAAAGADQQ